MSDNYNEAVTRNHPDVCPNCGSDEVYFERFGNEIVCHDCGWSIEADTGILKFEGEKFEDEAGE